MIDSLSSVIAMANIEMKEQIEENIYKDPTDELFSDEKEEFFDEI